MNCRRRSSSCCHPKLVPLFNESGKLVPTSHRWGHVGGREADPFTGAPWLGAKRQLYGAPSSQHPGHPPSDTKTCTTSTSFAVSRTAISTPATPPTCEAAWPPTQPAKSGPPATAAPSPDLLRGLPTMERRQSPRALPQERLRQAFHPQATEPLFLDGEVDVVGSTMASCCREARFCRASSRCGFRLDPLVASRADSR